MHECLSGKCNIIQSKQEEQMQLFLKVNIKSTADVNEFPLTLLIVFSLLQPRSQLSEFIYLME